MSDIKGLLEAGNIDLKKRPVVKNDDGTISTVRSMSFEQDGTEILIPTVSQDGRLLNDDEAIEYYRSTGEHLGKFDNPDDATAYAGSLHDDQAALYGDKPQASAWNGWSLPDAAALPASRSSGPESWGEAWTKAAGTTDQTMQVIENITAGASAQRGAYEAYINEVEQATGVRLKNPTDVDLRRGAFEARPNPQYGFGTGAEWIDERIQAATDEFEASRAQLAARFPAQARLIQLDIEGRTKRLMQDAEKKNQEALQSPELGMAGRLSAQLVGGLTGSARDPYQWMMALTGAGGSTSATVAGRIGKTMLTEALLNGGQEAVLQAASQDRKKRAGLEHGLNDALANVGIAATFGSLFGGTVQGGAELARIYRLGEGGEKVAARILDGTPERGDIEIMAKAMGVELSPEKRDFINRSFEERVLDDYMVSGDASPAQIEVMQAAERYATDPDNFPPPDVIERLVAEREAGRLLTMTPEAYERIYGGDQNAIDDIADTFFGEDATSAPSAIGAGADASPSISGPARPVMADGRNVDIGGGALPERGVVVANVHSDGRVYIGEPGDVHFSLADRYGDERFGSPEFTGFINADGRIMDRQEAFRWVSENEKPVRVSENMGEQLDALDYREQVPVAQRRAASAPRGAAPAADPIQGQVIRPSAVAEPVDVAALRDAEVRAGEIAEPARDKNGNPENYLDFIAIEDGNGKVEVVSVREALEIADEPEFLADLLEACKL